MVQVCTLRFYFVQKDIMRLSYCYKVSFGLACGILCLYAFDLFFPTIHLVFNKRYLKMPKVRRNILEDVSYSMAHNLSIQSWTE